MSNGSFLFPPKNRNQKTKNPRFSPTLSCLFSCSVPAFIQPNHSVKTYPTEKECNENLQSSCTGLAPLILHNSLIYSVNSCFLLPHPCPMVLAHTFVAKIYYFLSPHSTLPSYKVIYFSIW